MKKSVLVLLLFFFPLSGSWASAPGMTLAFEKQADDTIALKVVAENAPSSTAGAQIRIRYDEDKFEPLSDKLALGPFFSGDARPLVVLNKVSSGICDLCLTLGSLDRPVEGSGLLASVRFREKRGTHRSKEETVFSTHKPAFATLNHGLVRCPELEAAYRFDSKWPWTHILLAMSLLLAAAAFGCMRYIIRKSAS